jgi:hypothetical protein
MKENNSLFKYKPQRPNINHKEEHHGLGNFWADDQ